MFQLTRSRLVGLLYLHMTLFWAGVYKRLIVAGIESVIQLWRQHVQACKYLIYSLWHTSWFWWAECTGMGSLLLLALPLPLLLLLPFIFYVAWWNRISIIFFLPTFFLFRFIINSFLCSYVFQYLVQPFKFVPSISFLPILTLMP